MKRIICCFLVLLLVMLGASPALAQLPGDFVDVQGHWAEKDIAVMSNLGLMSGIGEDGRENKVFAPGNVPGLERVSF